MESKITTIESEIQMPGLRLPLKSAVVSVKNGVVLISPLPDLSAFQHKIESLGTPTDIVAPNGFHHLGLAPAKRLYPSARLWGVPILQKKQPQLKWHSMLPDGWPYSEELEIYPVLGMPKIDEMVFFHKPTKTLIVTDLCFNHVHGHGLGYWIVFHMFGTYLEFSKKEVHFLKRLGFSFYTSLGSSCQEPNVFSFCCTKSQYIQKQAS